MLNFVEDRLATIQIIKERSIGREVDLAGFLRDQPCFSADSTETGAEIVPPFPLSRPLDTR